MPSAFLWRDPPSGAEMITLYHPGGYGGVMLTDAVVVPGLSHALIMAFNQDNQGPQNVSRACRLLLHFPHTTNTQTHKWRHTRTTRGRRPCLVRVVSAAFPTYYTHTYKHTYVNTPPDNQGPQNVSRACRSCGKRVPTHYTHKSHPQHARSPHTHARTHAYTHATYRSTHTRPHTHIHTHTNNRPSLTHVPRAEVLEIIAQVKLDFPGAEIRASTWDAFTSLLVPLAHTLPLVEQEMGDTWIYGAASGARPLDP